jgi:CPA2 family monovalent cation:H+ antiporter-2
METAFVYSIIFVLLIALLGGISARFLKLQPIIGYLVAGVIFGGLFPHNPEIGKLAEIGVILLLFSVGLELSFSKISKVLKPVTIGAFVQIVPITAISYVILTLLGFQSIVALVLAAGFSISSTSVLVKILTDRGETGTLHGEFMLAWTLVEDLAIIPMIVLLPSLKETVGLPMLLSGGRALLISGLVIAASLIIGRLVAPFLIHRMALLNSRELLIVSAVFLAIGTSAVTSFFGMSPALGAFLAGVVISESQENHAVFAETRPLRDILVALFFVSLGFLVNINFVIPHLVLIFGLVILVIIIKFLVVSLLTLALGYHGKTAIAAGLGLAQVGDLAFVFYLQAANLKLLSPEMTSVAIAVALITLIISPFLFRLVGPIWQRLRQVLAGRPGVSRLVLGWDKNTIATDKIWEKHIVVCGYGRVGGWVGKALAESNIPFIVIDYNQNIVSELRRQGIEAIYGDPAHPEVLEAAGIEKARAIVVAIPDSAVQEEIIAFVQTKAPDVKIISRVHLDEEWGKIKMMKVDKIVQPEFEAAVAIIRSVLTERGKTREEVSGVIKALRVSHGR